MDGGMRMSDIMFEHLTKTYPNGFISVDDVTLKIQDGEFVVFHGPSGCGKSTILRMIGGLEDITSGKIYLGDELLNDILPRDRKLAMAFQNYLLYKYLNVYENMALGLRLRDFPRNVIDNRVNTAAQFLGISAILHEKIKKYFLMQRSSGSHLDVQSSATRKYSLLMRILHIRTMIDVMRCSATSYASTKNSV